MKSLVRIQWLIPVAALLAGCGHKEIGARAHEEASPSGASFKAGKGIVLTDEARKNLGMEVVDVAERTLQSEHIFTVQVFGEKHHSAANPQDHSDCDAHGSALVASETAALVQPGQPVRVGKGTNTALAGVVLSVQPTSTPGEFEVVIGVPNAATILRPGEFVVATFSVPGRQNLTAIPQPALLHTVDGTFVYTVNGEAFLRTAVKVGGKADGWVEILDGLLTGDQVVTKAVESLWLIELRATNGGDACTH